MLMAITSGIIKRCLEECEKSTYRFRVGAVIFSSKRIISSGHNEIRSSNIPSKHKLYNNSVHAEQAALLGTDWNKLKGCSILVMRCSKTKGSLSNAKPCPLCQKLLAHIGIRNIYYSNEMGEIVHAKLEDL